MFQVFERLNFVNDAGQPAYDEFDCGDFPTVEEAQQKVHDAKVANKDCGLWHYDFSYHIFNTATGEYIEVKPNYVYGE